MLAKNVSIEIIIRIGVNNNNNDDNTADIQFTNNN